MLIYIREYSNGLVTFILVDWDSAYGYDAFIKEYGDDEITCNKSDAFEVMGNIDSWYIDTLQEGCVRFEFG